MEYFILGFAALLASGLTLFSGFGLGTLLMPVFAVFFPIDVAIALTATVHLLNNLFKLVLFANHAVKEVVLRFGIPAVVAALLGAWLLVWLSDLQPLFSYSLFSNSYEVMPVKLVVAILMLGFAGLEVIPESRGPSFEARSLPLGGLLSGFFGGLSGHQGAFRSAFLLRCGLSKEQFIATGVVIACMVDFSRLAVYLPHVASATSQRSLILVTAIASAFIGTYLGTRFLKKVTMRALQMIVSIMLGLIALFLGAGIL